MLYHTRSIHMVLALVTMLSAACASQLKTAKTGYSVEQACLMKAEVENKRSLCSRAAKYALFRGETRAALTFFRRACALDVVEDCKTAGRMYEKNPANYRKALHMYKTGCDQLDGESCYLLARLYHTKLNNLAKALPHYSYACAEKYALSCYMEGRIYEYEKKKTTDAAALYELCCDLKSSTSWGQGICCHSAAVLYYKWNMIAKAAKLYFRGCNKFNYKKSCAVVAAHKSKLSLNELLRKAEGKQPKRTTKHRPAPRAVKAQPNPKALRRYTRKLKRYTKVVAMQSASGGRIVSIPAIYGCSTSTWSRSVQYTVRDYSSYKVIGYCIATYERQKWNSNAGGYIREYCCKTIRERSGYTVTFEFQLKNPLHRAIRYKFSCSRCRKTNVMTLSVRPNSVSRVTLKYLFSSTKVSRWRLKKMRKRLLNSISVYVLR